jgi:hypothetical protein
MCYICYKLFVTAFDDMTAVLTVGLEFFIFLPYILFILFYL